MARWLAFCYPPLATGSAKDYLAEYSSEPSTPRTLVLLTIMVNTHSKQPVFDLDAIRKAAKRNESFMMTRRARNQAEDLDHGSEAVRAVVIALTPDEFHHVWVLRDERKRVKLDANGHVIQYDVYTPTITAPNGDRCKIYLKLKLTSQNQIIVTVESFHLPEREL
ncbi:type II toxin-antitoxin system MqsR family toxin [Pseudomonas sp. XK-1]|uniref:type II toxin-antitoxin system MqsR family toxin n=1 Tax=Pseudomonas sp. XK-1 TaxID=3136019 RepID=UPI0031197F76